MKKLLILVLCIGFWGCSHMEHYVSDSVDIPKGSVIGVIPFDNESDNSKAGKRVANILALELQSSDIQVSAPAYGFRKPTAVTATDERKYYSDMGKSLNAQYLLTGTVLDYKYTRKKGKNVPVLALNARLIEASTGAVVWRTAAYTEKKNYSLNTLTHVVCRKLVSSIDVN